MAIEEINQVLTATPKSLEMTVNALDKDELRWRAGHPLLEAFKHF